MVLNLIILILFIVIVSIVFLTPKQSKKINIEKLDSISYKEVYSEKILLTDGETDLFTYNLSKRGDIMVTRSAGHLPFLKPICMNMIQEKKYIPEIQDYFKNVPLGTSSILHKQKGDWTLLKAYKPLDNSKRRIYGFEDPRLFEWDSSMWVITTFFGNSSYFNSDTNEDISGLTIFEYHNPDNIYFLEYKYRQEMEKNWLPFEVDKKLYFIYSISPFTILKYDGNGKCEKIITNDGFESKIKMGGSVSPIHVIKDNKGVFLSAGHLSSKNNVKNSIGLIRKNFFFTFEDKYPFRLLEYTSVFSFDKNINVEYMCGLELKNDNFHIHYGVEDCYNRSIIIDKKTLFSKFKPFNSAKDHFA
jgi:hypothetical protein